MIRSFPRLCAVLALPSVALACIGYRGNGRCPLKDHTEKFHDLIKAVEDAIPAAIHALSNPRSVYEPPFDSNLYNGPGFNLEKQLKHACKRSRNKVYTWSLMGKVKTKSHSSYVSYLSTLIKRLKKVLGTYSKREAVDLKKTVQDNQVALHCQQFTRTLLSKKRSLRTAHDARMKMLRTNLEEWQNLRSGLMKASKATNALRKNGVNVQNLVPLVPLAGMLTHAVRFVNQTVADMKLEKATFTNQMNRAQAIYNNKVKASLANHRLKAQRDRAVRVLWDHIRAALRGA